MLYKRLGQSGIKVSAIGLGSWLVYNDEDQDRADRIHRAAYDAGINFFDTANAYGGGAAEAIVGRALAPFRRDTLVIASKLFWPLPNWPFPGANDRGLSRKHIFEQCEASLRRIDTDYLDLYQCHRFDPETSLEETCRAMNDLIDHGKVLYWGVSEWTADQIAAAVELCRAHGWHRPASNQPVYNMLERHWEADVFPTCHRLGLGIVSFSPLCEGLLTGKYARDVPDGSRAADDRSGQWLRERMTDANRAIVQQLVELADGAALSLAHLALAWCHRREELTSTIVGASTPEQIAGNAAAAEVQLDHDVLAQVTAILDACHAEGG